MPPSRALPKAAGNGRGSNNKAGQKAISDNTNVLLPPMPPESINENSAHCLLVVDGQHYLRTFPGANIRFLCAVCGKDFKFTTWNRHNCNPDRMDDERVPKTVLEVVPAIHWHNTEDLSFVSTHFFVRTVERFESPVHV